MESRKRILQKIRSSIQMNGRCIGVSAGSGMTARCATEGGADFILALSAGKFRQIGLGSFASLLSYANSNQLVMDFGRKELLPAVTSAPVLFGLNATDPTIDLYDFLKKIKSFGFAGINNFPTVGLIDGTFRKALEADGITFASEVEAVRLANFLDLFTVAFVFDKEQTEAMLDAGADVICIHFGLTTGGQRGARKSLTLEKARAEMDTLMTLCEQKRPGIIKMVYGGPISKPEDMRRFYENPLCNGYIGGSAFERIPVEKAMTDTVRAFRFFDGSPSPARLHPGREYIDDISFIRIYVENHYSESLSLGLLADLLHRSLSYLSTKFRRMTGETFTNYLIRFRMDKAIELMENNEHSLLKIAEAVGYNDYTQFSKTFKKQKGAAPRAYRASMKK